MAWERLNSPKDKKVGLTYTRRDGLDLNMCKQVAEKWLARGAGHDYWIESGLTRFLVVGHLQWDPKLEEIFGTGYVVCPHSSSGERIIYIYIATNILHHRTEFSTRSCHYLITPACADGEIINEPGHRGHRGFRINLS